MAYNITSTNATITSATFFDLPNQTPVVGQTYTSTFTGMLTSGQSVVAGERYTAIGSKLVPFLDKSNQIKADQKSLKLGGFFSIDTPHTINYLKTIETKLSFSPTNKFKFCGTNQYTNIFFDDTTGWERLKQQLDGGYNCNFFTECFGSTGGNNLAQLADIKNGLYDAQFTGLLNRIVDYWDVQNPTRIPTETRIAYMHEWNLSDYPWALGYNLTNKRDWASTAGLVTPARGFNSIADLIPALERIGNLIKAHPAYIKGYVRRLITLGQSHPIQYELKDFMPARDTYDYMGIHVYDRIQMTVGGVFAHRSMLTILKYAGIGIYKQLTDLTDAPILITESASAANPNQTNLTGGIAVTRNGKQFKSKWLIEAWNDLINHFPQIIEYYYFRPRGALPTDIVPHDLSEQDYLDFRPHIHRANLRQNLTLEDSSRESNINANLLTKDYTIQANWLAGGASAGAVNMYTSVDTISGSVNLQGLDAGQDGGKANSKLVTLEFNNGTDRLDNYLMIQELPAITKINMPYTLSFRAWTNKLNARMLVGTTKDTTFDYTSSGVIGVQSKLERGWNTYITTFFPTQTATTTQNFFCAIGGQRWYTTLPVLTPTIAGGIITAITITDPGSGIDDGDYNIVCTGGSTTTNLQCRVVGGVVVSTNITAGGTGHTASTLALQPRVLMIDVDTIKLERGEVATPTLPISSSSVNLSAIPDNTFGLIGDVDASKVIKFNSDTITTTATTKILGLPSLLGTTGTFALLESSNSFTNPQTYSTTASSGSVNSHTHNIINSNTSASSVQARANRVSLSGSGNANDRVNLLYNTLLTQTAATNNIIIETGYTPTGLDFLTLSSDSFRTATGVVSTHFVKGNGDGKFRNIILETQNAVAATSTTAIVAGILNIGANVTAGNHNVTLPNHVLATTSGIITGSDFCGGSHTINNRRFTSADTLTIVPFSGATISDGINAALATLVIQPGEIVNVLFRKETNDWLVTSRYNANVQEVVTIIDLAVLGTQPLYTPPAGRFVRVDELILEPILITGTVGTPPTVSVTANGNTVYPSQSLTNFDGNNETYTFQNIGTKATGEPTLPINLNVTTASMGATVHQVKAYLKIRTVK